MKKSMIEENCGRSKMEKEYRVIALDMDGTVLNDEKQMGERTKAAIHRALAAGKEVIFCTGRSYAEMEEILEEFPDMHYLCGESGAMLYDLRKKCPVRLVSIPLKERQKLWKTVEGREIMPQLFSEGKSVINASQLYQMEHYQMGVYQDAFVKVCTLVEDVVQTSLQTESAEKINLYHTSPAQREETLRLLREAGVELTMVYSEISSLECSPLGLSKASGLQALCQELGITLQQIIMVGDADNDLEALKAAGLAVAMGNANERVKAVCQARVADNNHDGCGEAIERYFLREGQEQDENDCQNTQ